MDRILRLTIILLTLCMFMIACQPSIGEPAEMDQAVSETPTLPTTQLPDLQTISSSNADEVQLISTLQIPGFSMGSISQCNPAFSPDGRLLAGACGRNGIPVWDVRSGQLVQTLTDGKWQMVVCRFSPDGSILACGGFDNQISFWDPLTGDLARSFASLDSPLWDLAFSPDGRYLASAGISSDIRLWSMDSADLVWSHPGRRSTLSLSFSPAGDRVAFGGRYGDAGILNALSGESILDLTGLSSKPVGSIAYNPPGDLLAAGTDDNFIYLWQSDQAEPVQTLAGHQDFVNGVAFSPDGSLLVSGSHDSSVRLWDAASGAMLSTLNGHTGAVLRVVFSPDGKLIASISWDGTLRLWGLPQ